MNTARKEQETDLFAWQARGDIEKQRAGLIARMKSTKPHSMARAELAIRLKHLTAQALKLEATR